jgi:hypothetical protein
MKKIMIGLVAMSSLVFGTGCGGNYCDDAADAVGGLTDKLDKCPELKAQIDQLDLEPSDAELDKCKEDLDDCSDDEKDKLNDTVDCINDLPDCESGKEADWGDKFLACANKSEGVSCL